MQSCIARQRGTENRRGAFALAGPAEARTTDLLLDSATPMKNKSLRLLTCGLLFLFTGALLRADPAALFNVLANFPSGLGSPYDLVQGSDGNFYGTTASGGSTNAGTVLKMTLAGVLTT